MDNGIIRINPPNQGFFSKMVECFGVPIKTSDAVSDEALLAARDRVADQLKNSPGIQYNMQQAGAELHIIGKDQGTSDLPYMRHMKGIICDLERDQDIDQRTRGVGGLNASCGEENVLMLEGDRYVDRDICRHEFAHTILEYGVDDDTREYVMCEYKRAVAQKRWPTCYAISNYHEYFAELTMWYFGFRGDLGRVDPKPGMGSEWLKSYDPEGWELIDRIYSGRWPVQKVTYTPLVALPAEQQPYVRSIESKDKPVRIIFDNQTNDNFRIFRIDEAGRLQDPRTLYCGDKEHWDTFAGHAWLITDMNGKTVNLVVAQEMPGKLVLR